MKLEVFIRSKASSNPETINLYVREARRFAGWLGSRELTLETVQEYESWLRARYKPNSLSNKTTGVNLYLEWRGTTFQIRRPPKQVAANPKLVTDAEYEALLDRIVVYYDDPKPGTPNRLRVSRGCEIVNAERLVVRIMHDSLLRPSDIVTIRLADLDTSDGVTVIRKRTQKTGSVSESILTRETAAALAEYVASSGVTDYLFPGEDGRPHRHRTWPNAVLRHYGAEGITPRTFRRTGATRWGDDITSLMAQGGWSDSRTVLKHYRQNLRERHVREFERAMGLAKDHDDDEPPGYA